MVETVLVTGSTGFIGFHLCVKLLRDGFNVVGIDAMTSYYDVALKEARCHILNEHANYRGEVVDILDLARLNAVVDDASPTVIVHLAAQAGVRFSIEQPRTYVETNIVGTFNVMECARKLEVRHLLMASTSSVYGANTDMPFAEHQKADEPLTIYAATKKATEVMGHSYAHLWKLPTTMIRFFTVYGPWGRPDMALFKFTRGIIDGTPIDIYNRGEMFRDFTYVEDLVHGIRLLIDAPPPCAGADRQPIDSDTLSPVAPFRVVNMGNSDKVRLLDFIEAIEKRIGKEAIGNFVEMQPGDVPATWADTSLLRALTAYHPETDFREGIAHFVDWYRDYYNV